MSSAPQPLNTPHDVKSLWARRLSASACFALTERGFSRYLDTAALPGGARADFRIPLKKDIGGKWDARLDGWGVQAPPGRHAPAENEARDEDFLGPCVYMAGNSLGLQHKSTQSLVDQELKVWADVGVLGHFNHTYDRPWKSFIDRCTPIMANITGAKPSEVVVTGTLTSNLHSLMSSFYRPTKERYKILFEKGAFPSDAYAFASQIQLHGRKPADGLIMMSPRKGEFTLRPKDIIDTINREGKSIALVIFPGVQYYTGQNLPIGPITAAAHAQGCMVGWDLAHAVGNVPLKLHDDDIDFAVWCSYKYLNGGPGAIGGLFVHERFTEMGDRPRLAGWWGHNPDTRFSMPPTFDPIRGAGQFAHSNPCVLSTISLFPSLLAFEEYPGGMKALRARSEELTGYLEACLKSFETYIAPSAAAEQIEYPSPLLTPDPPSFTIITPSLPFSSRGSQLSLLFLPPNSGLMKRVFGRLVEFGVLGDERDPDVIRLAPTAMYSTFEDCRRAAQAVQVAMDEERVKWMQVVRQLARDVAAADQKAAENGTASGPTPTHKAPKMKKGSSSDGLQRSGSI